MQTIIIVAMTPDRLIGKGGALPWHDPEDLKHFKRTTMGHAVIMGRKTFDSIGRPLPGRRNIVVTRNVEALERNVEKSKSQKVKTEDATSLDVVHSLGNALELCRRRGEDKVFIVGGAQIYEQALPIADEMVVTWIQQPRLTGDTYFPAWREEDWEVSAESALGAHKIVRYRRLGR